MRGAEVCARDGPLSLCAPWGSARCHAELVHNLCSFILRGVALGHAARIISICTAVVASVHVELSESRLALADSEDALLTPFGSRRDFDNSSARDCIDAIIFGTSALRVRHCCFVCRGLGVRLRLLGYGGLLQIG